MSRSQLRALALSTIVAVALAGLTVTISAAEPRWLAFGGGGQDSSSTNYQLSSTIGQTGPIGISTNVSQRLEAGLWYGLSDRDGDGLVEIADNCPVVSNPGQENADGDQYGNVCDNCPSWANPGQVLPAWSVPVGDSDCDGYPGSVPASGKGPESSIGTDAADHCANTAPANDEGTPDAWPVDFNDDQKATILDVATFSSVFGSLAPGPPYNVRHDFNASGSITITDVAQYSAFFGKSCSP